MAARVLASLKQRRGEITTDEDVNRVFKHLYKDKPTPADPKTNLWKVKPFTGIIRGEFHQSSLEHDTEVTIKNLMQLADHLNISKRALLYLIYDDFANGAPTSARTLADATVAEYQKTLCHQYLAKHYQNPVTGIWTKGGEAVDALGRYLYMKNDRHDPALFTLEDFQQAKKDPRFYDEQGKLKFSPLSRLRCIITFAALQVEDSPLSQKRFRFMEGDEWDTTGKKNIGSKKDDYLQEKELEAFVRNINEIDTLALYRLSLEGGGRISSQLLMGTKTSTGYLSQAFWEQGAISMFEPKVELSKTGGKVKRYFVPKTMDFFKRYTEDKKIIGAWFHRYESLEQNHESYSTSLRLAGLRAGIWRYKTATKTQTLAEGEKIAPDGRVYRLKPIVDNQKGTTRYSKQWLTEGKMTTSHTVGKHTFVSLAGLHGLSLDDCADQCGTDPTTIKDFYHGTLGDKRKAAILGVKEFTPWIQWINEFVEPLFTNRYNELMKQGKTTIDMAAIAQEEAAMAEVAE